MLGSVAKRTAAEFFTAVESHLTALAAPMGEPPAVSGTAEPIVSGTATRIVPGTAEPGAVAGEPGRPVYSRPGKEGRPGVPAWSLLAAFGMGAGVALGSAVIGWLLVVAAAGADLAGWTRPHGGRWRGRPSAVG